MVASETFISHSHSDGCFLMSIKKERFTWFCVPASNRKVRQRSTKRACWVLLLGGSLQFGRVTILLMELSNHGYYPLTNWDDPSNASCPTPFLPFASVK